MYYDGTKLLSLLDLNKNKPELYISTSTRSTGKTTYFSRLLINRFKKKRELFVLIYRYNYELKKISEKFFTGVQELFFPCDEMTEKNVVKDTIVSLYLNEELCGYAVSLNNAELIKKSSHLLSTTSHAFFDEFQSESNHYCYDEINKFLSLHKTLARGGGKQVKYYPIYMASNFISLINPYYTELNIGARLNDDTKYLRGNGFVLECYVDENVSKQMLNSGISQAFKNNNYLISSTQKVYLNDNKNFISNPKGKNRYICTIKAKDKLYALREYDELGIIYCNTNIDNSCKLKLSVLTNDMDINYVLLKKNDFLITRLRFFFEKGCFRFKDLECKNIIFKLLTY